jgi:tRNA 2-thiouridine synthesizing protein A
MDWDAINADETWDAGDLGCGELISELRRRVNALQPHQTIHVIAKDLGARLDIQAWCRLTGHALQQADHPNYFIARKES